METFPEDPFEMVKARIVSDDERLVVRIHGFAVIMGSDGDCKSMNLIYQLQCTVCNAFYIGEIRHSLSDQMNGHCFTTTVSNPDLPVAIHTQSHQIPFQECWSVRVIHKLPNSTPDHIHCQFETAYQLVLQSRHTPISTSVNHPLFHPRQSDTYNIYQSSLLYC